MYMLCEEVFLAVALVCPPPPPHQSVGRSVVCLWCGVGGLAYILTSLQLYATLLSSDRGMKAVAVPWMCIAKFYIAIHAVCAHLRWELIFLMFYCY